MTPTLHKSTFSSYPAPWMISGAVYLRATIQAHTTISQWMPRPPLPDVFSHSTRAIPLTDLPRRAAVPAQALRALDPAGDAEVGDLDPRRILGGLEQKVLGLQLHTHSARQQTCHEREGRSATALLTSMLMVL